MDICATIITEDYLIARKKIKSFDLVFFKNKGFGASIIRYSEWLSSINRDNKSTMEYSHIGIILSSDILSGVENIEPDNFYIWESTPKGRKNINVKTVWENDNTGVQLYKLDDVVYKYTEYYHKKTHQKNSCISFGLLNEESRKNINAQYEHIQKTFVKNIFNLYQGMKYNGQPLSLLGSAITLFRNDELNNHINSILQSNKWLFCSQLVAVVYKNIGLFPADCRDDYVLPTDFLGHDSDGLPMIINPCIEVIVKMEK